MTYYGHGTKPSTRCPVCGMPSPAVRSEEIRCLGCGTKYFAAAIEWRVRRTERRRARRWQHSMARANDEYRDEYQ
jgi:hypothetical protein